MRKLELINSFEIKSGARQGRVLSFPYSIQLCYRLDNGHHLALKRISPDHRVTDLEYALFADSYGEMQILLKNLSTTAARIKLRIKRKSYIQKAN